MDIENKQYRIEKDSLGEVSVPIDAYYGAQTARARENFPISGIRHHFSIIGNDLTITMASQAGQFELIVMMPVMQYKLLDSISILTNALKVFTDKCIKGITVNEDRCYQYATGSMAMVTALNPYIGYSMAAVVVKESLLTGKSIKKIVLGKN